MTEITKAYIGAGIHDGHHFCADHALALYGDGTRAILRLSDLPAQTTTETLNGGIITPGFVDLQVNGGGGVMFNDDPSVATLRTIAAAHAVLGTAMILPTLITDTPEKTRAAIEAAVQAINTGVRGIAGLHLEGPHLSVARKGAHDANLIRPMTQDDLDLLIDAAKRLPNLMVTVAPENTTNAQIRAIADAGIIVSLGHTDADFATCMAAFEAGARCVTHLFNAMSPLTSREPGLVGAALAHPRVYAGLIADGIHVDPATIQIALAASKSDNILLVSDAMATAGSPITSFTLGGRDVVRRNRRLTLADGTLAGADLEMTQAIATMVSKAGDDLATAIRRATGLPLSLLRGFEQDRPLLDRRLSISHLADDLSAVTRLCD